jgi:ribosomal protein S14
MNGRCILTNRKGSIDRKFLLSRIVLRDLMQFGIIPGFKKAVW